MYNTTVKVEQGVVVGCIEELPNNGRYLRFSGIPYAKPPINELRFRSPQKLERFDTAKIDCSKEGDDCFQKSIFTMNFVGSENCLYLNVYVPETSFKKLAVMVWIHG
jgi:carboxylesterase type B